MPNNLAITTQAYAAPQSSYVDVGYNIVDSNGNGLASGAQTVSINIVSAPVIVSPVQPTPASNLNAAVNAAVAKSRCKPGSGFGPHDGCAIAVNKILDTVLGHTVPRVEGGPYGYPAVPGSETCYSDDPVTATTAAHPCHLEWVPDVVELLVKDGYAVQLSTVPLLQGDIAVQDGNDPIGGMAHIGFCDNDGCTQTISNADSLGELCGVSNASYSSGGYPWPANEQPTFYRLVKK
jgi:hypothetical protein